MLKSEKIIGPLYTQTRFKDMKDPCIVFDGNLWHIFGSGGSVKNEVWQILHATASDILGPWVEAEPVVLSGLKGNHVAAPSVYFDSQDQNFHMVVQTEFSSIGGTIEYLRSADGCTFTRIDTLLTSVPDTTEAGIYDPHQVVIGERKYIVYAGTEAIEGHRTNYIIQPDVHLAQNQNLEMQSSWTGPWQRLGVILNHENINWHHNPRYHDSYEWGIEGPQIVCLPDGQYLLNATCFLSEGKFGTRQRVFFALVDKIEGPYTSLGPVINPTDYLDQEWMNGENGHASAHIVDQTLYLFFQARSQNNELVEENDWRYGIATFTLPLLKNIN